MVSSNERLSALLDALGLSRKKAHLIVLGKKLALIIGREKPYTYGHLLSVLTCNDYPPGKELGAAIDAALAQVDGMQPQLAASKEARVFGPPRADLQNAYIYGETVICPDCVLKFVRDHPLRERCKICSPPRRRKHGS